MLTNGWFQWKWWNSGTFTKQSMVPIMLITDVWASVLKHFKHRRLNILFLRVSVNSKPPFFQVEHPYKGAQLCQEECAAFIWHLKKYYVSLLTNNPRQVRVYYKMIQLYLVPTFWDVLEFRHTHSIFLRKIIVKALQPHFCFCINHLLSY